MGIPRSYNIYLISFIKSNCIDHNHMAYHISYNIMYNNHISHPIYLTYHTSYHILYHMIYHSIYHKRLYIILCLTLFTISYPILCCLGVKKTMSKFNYSLEDWENFLNSDKDSIPMAHLKIRRVSNHHASKLEIERN